MSEKSQRKKNLIIEKARQVFSEKGFRTVTMKDIVEACEISRGGLYLYFDSTESLFKEVLKTESEEAEDDVFEKAVSGKMTSAEILALFLKEQKKEILKKEGALTMAIYEFYFATKLSKRDNILRRQFDEAVLVIEKLIADGVENGEFYCEDAKGAARNIMYVLEGLKIRSQTVGISAGEVNHEIMYIMRGLVGEE
ncbi:MAG: TetR/AcrR family transcriptional regulator [Lachnospiraceae bacterium]|nr:TetR/AcrR family transcriptional regulator [Lachnospiraceae bacterium]